MLGGDGGGDGGDEWERREGAQRDDINSNYQKGRMNPDPRGETKTESGDSARARRP